jgi:hypothetical protein
MSVDKPESAVRWSSTKHGVDQPLTARSPLLTRKCPPNSDQTTGLSSTTNIQTTPQQAAPLLDLSSPCEKLSHVAPSRHKGSVRHTYQTTTALWPSKTKKRKLVDVDNGYDQARIKQPISKGESTEKKKTVTFLDDVVDHGGQIDDISAIPKKRRAKGVVEDRAQPAQKHKSKTATRGASTVTREYMRQGGLLLGSDNKRWGTLRSGAKFKA